MALFLVRREVPGAGEEDVRTAILRAVSCAYNFEGMQWVKTYWNEGAGVAYCVYHAGSPEEVRRHAELARVPCDDVMPVTEITPEDLLTPVDATPA